MIVSLKKFLIYGSRKSLDAFFELSQKAGFIEFVGLMHKNALELPEEAQNILSALKIVRQHAESAPLSMDLPPPAQLAEEILQVQAELGHLEEERRMLTVEKSRIAPFGDFSREDVDFIEKEGKCVVQFFCMKSDLSHEITHPPEMIYVGSEYDLDYFVAIQKERAQYPNRMEIWIEKPIGVLMERLSILEKQIREAQKKIHDFSSAQEYLHNGLNDILNDYHLNLAKHDAALALDETFFAIEAWVPSNRIKALQGVISHLEIHFEPIAKETEEVIPTHMQNKGAAKIGEDLVQFYDTPSSQDKDPSLWVLSSFAVFFAMIISDAGYGLVYLCIGLFFFWKFPKASGLAKRTIRLTLLLGSCCIGWGILTASYFGIELAPESPLNKPSMLYHLSVQKAQYHLTRKDAVYREIIKEHPPVASAQSAEAFVSYSATSPSGKVTYPILDEFYDNLLMECSLLVGVIHIVLSFLRYILRNPVGIGWICFMIGGYLFFPSILPATSLVNFLGIVPQEIAYPLGKQMVYLGLGLVVFISLLQKKKWGALHELTNAIQVFGDVLSYLRLYALSLAGMMMAKTFNSMGAEAGWVGGGIILLVGHLVNLNLSVMGGVIHGLRLNFLEWYHYSFEGGGRLFNPLRMLKTK